MPELNTTPNLSVILREDHHAWVFVSKSRDGLSNKSKLELKKFHLLGLGVSEP
jgi:hypothetical protein